MKKSRISRRSFLGTAAVGAAGAVAPVIITSCSSGKPKPFAPVDNGTWLDAAPDGPGFESRCYWLRWPRKRSCNKFP